MTRLIEQTAIVTGGGRGIGRAIALALGREGANVVVSARTRPEIDDVVAAIRQAGGRAESVQADVTSADDVAQLVAQVKETFGAIDILVNNAGGIPNSQYGAVMNLWDLDEEHWDLVMALNLKSIFLLVRAIMPEMLARRSGHIVNIASAMGHGAWPVGGAYVIAKHGVVAMTESLALAAMGHGVRVNAVSPGLIDTPGQRALMESLRIPSRPLSAPETVADAVRYLLCDSPEEMTGQTLRIYPAR